jgi:hypothetical protein
MMRQSLIAAVLVSVAACAPNNDSPVDELVAGFGEIGPIRLGMSQAQMQDAIGATLSPGYVLSEDERQCYYLRAEGRFSGIGFMMNNDRLVRYDVWESAIRTRAGVGIGNTRDEVAASYDQQIQVLPHKYTDGSYVTVTDGNDIKLLFETDASGKVEQYRSGRAPEVDYVEGCL